MKRRPGSTPPTPRWRKQAPPQDPDTRPFHAKHLITFLWALAASLVTLVAAIAYQFYQGPQAVTVVNPDTATRIITVSDSISREYLQGVLKELQSLRRETTGRTQTVVPVPTESPAAPYPPVLEPNPVQVPAYVLPARVQGYTGADLRDFATYSCPPDTIRVGQDVRVIATLRRAADTTKLSPMVVSITKTYRDGGTSSVRAAV